MTTPTVKIISDSNLAGLEPLLGKELGLIQLHGDSPTILGLKMDAEKGFKSKIHHLKNL